jgi:hypothetical protein
MFREKVCMYVPIVLSGACPEIVLVFFVSIARMMVSSQKLHTRKRNVFV